MTAYIKWNENKKHVYTKIYISDESNNKGEKKRGLPKTEKSLHNRKIQTHTDDKAAIT